MIRFLKNQTVHEIQELDPNTSVLDYLREQLCLPGTKEGCASGDCGTCTIVLGEPASNGIRYKAVNACLLPIGTLHGKQLITVEDLSSRKVLHPAQQVIVEHHASQCGFCTPGCVMSMFALQKNNPLPDRQNIVDALGGNICRCTGYEPIVDAILEASRNTRGAA